MHTAIRSLRFVKVNLGQMEPNNQRLREQPGFRKAGIRFTPMPSPATRQTDRSLLSSPS